MINQRRALRTSVLLASLVPIAVDLGGFIWGSKLFDKLSGPELLDSHVRYLSGLLLAIGLAFITTVPKIERHGGRFHLLTAIVFIGGVARLIGVILSGAAYAGVLFALFMELAVTPGLAIWQKQNARFPPDV